MSILFLRGKEPTDRNPAETYYKNIETCDDIWTLLADKLAQYFNSIVNVSYWGSNTMKFVKLSKNCFDLRVRQFDDRFNKELSQHNPNIIFARGGFKEYHSILKAFPKAFKIYYGAGRRYMPIEGFTDYQLILTDSVEQMQDIQRQHPHIPVSLFVKPAPDNIMNPINTKKEYDICFPANGQQYTFKGHEFVFKTTPSKYKVLNLGFKAPLKYPKNIDSIRVSRTHIAQYYSKCKMGIVCCSGSIDSCPRVISEMICCGLPIVVLKGVRFWEDKYINYDTGICTDKKNFWNAADWILNNLSNFNPRRHYDNHLSLNKAAQFLANVIKFYRDK